MLFHFSFFQFFLDKSQVPCLFSATAAAIETKRQSRDKIIFCSFDFFIFPFSNFSSTKPQYSASFASFVQFFNLTIFLADNWPIIFLHLFSVKAPVRSLFSATAAAIDSHVTKKYYVRSIFSFSYFPIFHSDRLLRLMRPMFFLLILIDF